MREQWHECKTAITSKDKGDTLETFAKGLFGEVFDVVSINRQTPFGEIDLICEVKQAAFWQRPIMKRVLGGARPSGSPHRGIVFAEELDHNVPPR